MTSISEELDSYCSSEQRRKLRSADSISLQRGYEDAISCFRVFLPVCVADAGPCGANTYGACWERTERQGAVREVQLLRVPRIRRTRRRGRASRADADDRGAVHRLRAQPAADAAVYGEDPLGRAARGPVRVHQVAAGLACGER